MLSFYITILFLGIAYTLALYYWNKKVTWRINEKLSFSLKRAHFFGVFFCLLAAFLWCNFNLKLQGFWTIRIIISITLLTGLLIYPMTKKILFSKIEQWYFKLFAYLPVFSAVLTLIVPFIGIILSLSLLGRLVLQNEIHYEDKYLKVQSTFQGILTGSKLDVFEKHFCLEKRLEIEYYSSNFIDSVHVLYELDSIRLKLYQEDKLSETLSLKHIE